MEEKINTGLCFCKVKKKKINEILRNVRARDVNIISSGNRKEKQTERMK